MSRKGYKKVKNRSFEEVVREREGFLDSIDDSSITDFLIPIKKEEKEDVD